MGYDDDIRLERRHASTICGILGKQFFRQDARLDHEEATDFATFTVSPFKVAARLRTNRYLAAYGDQFTIRWSRPSGVPTEIDKIRAGLVDYIIYGFVSADERHIVRYFIGDLETFREQEPRPMGPFPNHPPESELVAYRVDACPCGFVIKSWPDDWAGATP